MKMRWPAAMAISLLFSVPASADCHSDGVAAIERGATSGPFRFQNQIKIPTVGSKRITGVVVPPDRAHTIMDDGHEFIQIGRRQWMKTPTDGKWHVLLHSALPARLGARGLDRIGSVRCLGEVIDDGRAYLAYEYDEGSGGSPKIPTSSWKVMTDRATGVPLKFLSRTGDLEEVETRVYEAGLDVDPPVGVGPVSPKR